MKDDELEIWRREWNSQPRVPVDLIRKVERQTVYMKLGQLTLILPLLIGVAATAAAVWLQTLLTIIFAVGVWSFILIMGYLRIKNSRGIWSPAADTTAAYVDLSIRRCRAQIKSIRLVYVVAPLLTTFVMAVDYLIIASYGVLKTRRDFLFMLAAFAYGGGIVAIVVWLMSKKRGKIEAELAYLLSLQRQIEN